MIAELANYRSWIAWVPFVALLAIPLLFRHVLAVSLAMAGAFVGFVLISASMPLGSSAEDLGANVAAGLLGGAALGGILGAALAARRHEPYDASVTVVGYAIGLGLLGVAVGGLGPSVLTGASPDLSVALLLTIAVGGGLGWSLGAVIGWRATPDAPSPGRAQRWILGVAAASVALFGAVVAASIQARAFGPSIDGLSRWDRHQLPLVAALYCIDTVLVVLTLVAVAVRRSGERPSSSVGAAAREGTRATNDRLTLVARFP